jgi:CRP-like cAMP-binding protein
VKGERVTADTWVYDAKNSAWQKAAQITELQMFFRSRPKETDGETTTELPITEIEAKALRRVKILAAMSDEQLQRFAQFMELEKLQAWTEVVRQGDVGNVMYLILEGEFRVRVKIDGKETILATLGIGEFFGDIALFDHGPRSADVVANTDGVVLKVTSEALERVAAEVPDLATPFLLAVGKTLAARIRHDNKRYSDSVKFARAAE